MLTAVFVTRWRTTIVRLVYFVLLHVFPWRRLVNRDVTKKQHPQALRPFIPEVEAFARFNHLQVLHPLLRCVDLYNLV